MGMGREEIIEDLKRLDDAVGLSDTGRGYILIAGSAALLINDEKGFRETKDVDVLRCSANVLSLLETCVGDFNNAMSTFPEPMGYEIEKVPQDFGLAYLDVETISDETSVLMKIAAGRADDIADIRKVVGKCDIDKLRRIVGSYEFAADLPSKEHWELAKKTLDDLVDCE